MKKTKKIPEFLSADMLIGICYGTPDKYRVVEFNRPISELIESPDGIEVIKTHFSEIHLKEGESILNTNLPEEIFQSRFLSGL